jgi:hypothetical protein
MVQMIAQPQVMPMPCLCAGWPLLRYRWAGEFLWFRVWLFAIVRESLTG